MVHCHTLGTRSAYLLTQMKNVRAGYLVVDHAQEKSDPRTIICTQNMLAI